MRKIRSNVAVALRSAERKEERTDFTENFTRCAC